MYPMAVFTSTHVGSGLANTTVLPLSELPLAGSPLFEHATHWVKVIIHYIILNADSIHSLYVDY